MSEQQLARNQLKRIEYVFSSLARFNPDESALWDLESTLEGLFKDLEATERERDELRLEIARIGGARAMEVLRRDAEVGEPVAWVCGDEEIRDFKAGREVTIVRDCDDSDLEYLPLYTAAPPAVLPHKLSMDIDPELQGEFRVHEAIRRKGFNQALAALALGAQQQKVVELPNQSEYEDPLSAYEALEHVKAALDAAGVKWEVKK